MEKKNFLLLLSTSAADKAALQAVNANIVNNVDRTAKPLWFDPTHVGFFLNTELTANGCWKGAVKDLQPSQTEAFRDMLVLEIGRDFAARSDSKTAAWLTSHGSVRRFG